MGIKIDLKIFIFLALFLVTNQSKAYATLMLFAIIHEFGHLIAGILLGLKPKKFKIMPFGVSISFEYSKKTNLQRFIIALAGPIMNLLIVIIFLFIPEFNERNLIIYSNILIALFNMLPIYPLDGGRVLKSLFNTKYCYKESDKIVNRISNIVAILITAISSIAILYLKNIGIVFIIFYIWLLVIHENKRYSIKRIVNSILEKDRIKRKVLETEANLEFIQNH